MALALMVKAELMVEFLESIINRAWSCTDGVDGGSNKNGA